MPILLCPHCSVGMVQKAGPSAEFEQCPSCKGAWFDQGKFEPFLQSFDRRQAPPIPVPFARSRALPFGMGRLLNSAIAALIVVTVGIGLAGYFVVLPVLSRVVDVGSQMIGRAVPSAEEMLRSEIKVRIPQAPADLAGMAQQIKKEAVDRALQSPQDAVDSASRMTKSAIDKMVQEGQRLSGQLDTGAGRPKP